MADQTPPSPGFFVPGTTYAQDRPFVAPELVRVFVCQAILAHPATGETLAAGFGRTGRDDLLSGPWNLAALDRHSWSDSPGWVALPAAPTPLTPGQPGR